MKRKLLCLFLTICLVCSCAMFLTACGGSADTTLYHLTITSNIGDKVSQDDLKAVFAYGCNGATVTEGTRDEDDVQELLKAGATQEEIDKAGKRQSDGSYYFYDQDPMYLVAPEVEGYVFKGFYNKANGEYLYRPSVDPNTNELYRWNMPAKDFVVEARYDVLAYQVAYCYGFDHSSGFDGQPLPSGLIGSANNTNPTTYNYQTKKDVTLVAPTQEFAGYEFKYWFYRKPGSADMVKCENLPKTYDEDCIAPTSYDSSGNATYSLTLFAYYEPVLYDVSFTVNNGVTVSVKNNDQTVDISNAVKVNYGTKLDVWVDVSEIPAGYKFDGIYVNGVKVPDIEPGNPSTRDYVEITGNATIVIKVVADD